MARRGHREPSWKAEAFESLAERLRGFEAALHGRQLLEVRCGSSAGCGFLLDWLRPSRLVAIDVDGPPLYGSRPVTSRAGSRYGEGASFDAAFLFARHQLKRAVRRLSLPEVARVLAPGGVLVVTSLAPRPWVAATDVLKAQLDSSAEAWGLLHSSLARTGFRVDEEHLGVSRLLVARRVEKAAS
jgi:SAM-dependent methyltransferase